MDYAGPIQGVWYLIIIDALTKWPEVFPTRTITATFTVEKLMECMARFGLVDEIVSDNGTQFTAKEFKSFVEANGIRHKLTAPGHPATNGAAENFVKTFKTGLKKACSDGSGRHPTEVLNNFLMAYRKSAHCSSKVSPAVALLGRELVTKFDRMLPKLTASESPKLEEIKENLTTAQQRQQKQFRGSRIQEFKPGESVLVRDYSDPNRAKWEGAVVEQVLGRRNYLVTLKKSNRRIKRHIDQMVPDTSVAKGVEPIPVQCNTSTSLALRLPSNRGFGSHSAKIVLSSETSVPHSCDVTPGPVEAADGLVELPPMDELEKGLGEAVQGFEVGWSVQGRKRKVKEVFPDPYARRTSKRLRASKYEHLIRMFLPLQNSVCKTPCDTSGRKARNGQDC